MHRPTLTLRRFGALSFGLGYYEDGIWVDHSTPEATAIESLTHGQASPSDRVAADAVHRWYGCCVASTGVERETGFVGASPLGEITPRLARGVVALMPRPQARAVEK
jgi:hypothetical protein